MTSNLFTIAIIDDHVSLRRSLNTYLSSEGIKIAFEAKNGEDLLSKLASGIPLPDICLLDINMPIMDGFETARQLKQHYPEILIMGYSSFNGRARIDKMLACGAHDFISKDEPPEELLAALQSLYETALACC